jgi:hypothetical protein
MCRNAEERKRAAAFLDTLADPRWRFEGQRKDGVEVWRLPSGRFHVIMGLSDVNAPPSLALKMFADPVAVFSRLFPRIDTMFIRGQVLEVHPRGETLCAAVFRLPALVGSGSAPGFPPREFVWRQFVTALPSGNVLVTAASGEDCARRPEVARGAVRGTLLTSGYYGRAHRGGTRTRVAYIASADPAGIIPSWLVNLACSKQAANVARLAALFADGRGLQL